MTEPEHNSRAIVIKVGRVLWMTLGRLGVVSAAKMMAPRFSPQTLETIMAILGCSLIGWVILKL